MQVYFIVANKSNIDTIIDIAHRTWFPTYEKINSKEQNEYMFKVWYSVEGLKIQMNSGQEFWIMYHNKIAIGFASYSMQNSETCKLNKIYLLAEYKGLGLGKRLLNHIEILLKSKFVFKLQLNVNRNNPSVLFYQKCGYAIVESVDIPFDKYWMNDYVMEKKLTIS